MTFIDLFSGIGGFRVGMEMAGHECKGHCEKDTYANKSYIAMHNPNPDEWFANDITKIKSEDIPYVDAWCFGFPCTDISVAGKQVGLDGARSSLFYTVIELIKGKKEEDKPTYLLIENVKNLFSVNSGWDFAKLLISLDEIGYDCEWNLYNTAWYLPQNRERVYIVASLRGRSARKVFSIPTGDGLHSEGPETGQNRQDCTSTITTDYHKGVHNRGETYVQVRAVLTPDRLEKRQNGRRMKNDGEPMFTLTSQDLHGVAISRTIRSNGRHSADRHSWDTYDIDGRIRRLTPRECFRLQGFCDKYFDQASKVCSDTQLYRQAGNAASTPVVYDVARRL